MGRILLHVLTVEESRVRNPDQPWTPAGFARDGFVHLCTPEQLVGVLQRHYAGRDVVVLAISEEKLGSQVLDEDLYGHGAFPHLYAPIPAHAVLEQVMLTAEVSAAQVGVALTSMRRLHG